MMKRMMAVILAATMVMFFTACGIGAGSKQGAPAQDTSANQGNTTNVAAKSESKYPETTIKMIVPFGAGGGADISIRMISKYAEKHLGQKIVVNNVTGGSGTVGLTQLADSKNDGYTLGYFASTNSNDNLLFEGISYNADSFTPIVEIAADPHIIVASKKSGITNIEQLIAKAKEKPGEMTFGIGGAWTSWDFLKIKLEEQTGIKMKRMVFQGGAAAINAIASGDCDVAVPFVSEALPQIQASNVIPIAITSSERFELAKDIPTVKESGLDFEHTMWRGIAAPAGVSEEVASVLADAFKAAYDDPEYQKEALKAGMFCQFKGGDDFKEFYLDNHEKYKAMIEKTDLSK
ncbi:tripartite tricarboxylate transporter substrate binding protein [Petroclostridium sp. X23]|uniref:tripartite tricarboxylate transporter substrate binding protein n=1 Tax=Petroclostridium sp. X23 TaxID=3045146 RepID=UPI0024ACB940|nr:tripartite tricarboxylate transporter substrate binding protein [Petroclostridium sp. X23]WHH60359.1 tripartite tricarboxylate transporter substrate binding protein [Petroclostridium sp. X23]